MSSTTVRDDVSDNEVENLDLDNLLKKSQQDWQSEVNKLLNNLLIRNTEVERCQTSEIEELSGKLQRAAEEIRDLKKKARDAEDETSRVRNDYEKDMQYMYEDIGKQFVLKQDFSQLYDQWRNSREKNIPGRVNASIRPKHQLKVSPPTFEDRWNEKPMKFLREFNEYCSITQVEPEEARYLLSQSLKGAAGEWWRIVQDELGDWSMFEAKFKAKFWGENRQAEVRKEMEYGCYDTRGKMSRCDYAMKIFGLAKDLSRRSSEEEIVAQIANHFNEDIRSAIFSREITTKDRLFQMLERYDNARNLNMVKTKENIRDPQSNDHRKSYDGNRGLDKRWEPHRNTNTSEMPRRTYNNFGADRRYNGPEKENHTNFQGVRNNRPTDTRQQDRGRREVNIIETADEIVENETRINGSVMNQDINRHRVVEEDFTGQGNE